VEYSLRTERGGPVEKIEIGEGTREQPEPTPPPPVSEQEPVATAARILLGLASLGLDTIGSRLRAEKGQEEPAELASTPSLADTMVGLASRSAQAASSFMARGADVAARGARSAQGATQIAGRLVPDFLNEPIDQARERLRLRLRRLGAVGREEIRRSRELAQEALDEGLDTLVGRLADSRELQLVIRTQSVTAGEEAVDSIRDQTARIDDRLESKARRLFRRPPRPQPSSSR
jgi:hypothetical protein